MAVRICLSRLEHMRKLSFGPGGGCGYGSSSNCEGCHSSCGDELCTTGVWPVGCWNLDFFKPSRREYRWRMKWGHGDVVTTKGIAHTEATYRINNIYKDILLHLVRWESFRRITLIFDTSGNKHPRQCRNQNVDPN